MSNIIEFEKRSTVSDQKLVNVTLVSEHISSIIKIMALNENDKFRLVIHAGGVCHEFEYDTEKEMNDAYDDVVEMI